MVTDWFWASDPGLLDHRWVAGEAWAGRGDGGLAVGCFANYNLCIYIYIYISLRIHVVKYTKNRNVVKIQLRLR